MSIIDYAKDFVNQPKRLSLTPDPTLNKGRGLDASLELPVLVDTIFSADIPETSEVTFLPIEARANVTDHVQPKPIQIEIEAGFTKYDNFWEQTIAGNALGFISGGVQKTLGPIAGTASAFGLAELRKEILKSATPWERFQKLKKLKDAVVLLSVKLFDQEYKSLIISSLSPRVDLKSGDGVTFKMTLQQISFVSFRTESVNIKKDSPPVKKRTKDKTESGVKPPVVKSNDSAAFNLFNKGSESSVGKAVGSFFKGTK